MNKDIINNYVFQNEYKEYFRNDLDKIIKVINLNCSKREAYKSISYSIIGNFNNKERIIDFPNIFTYTYSVLNILNNQKDNFGKLNAVSNTMDIDFKKRQFKQNSFSKNLDRKLNLLLNEYEYMYKIDIRNFYKSIYTHVFTKLEHQDGSIDKYIRLYNNDKTNSLLLGNILSTLTANEIMDNMCLKIQNLLLNTKVEYFSDQFYIYFNYEYKSAEILDVVKNIIGKDYYEFEINENETKIYNHEELLKLRVFKRELDDLYDIQNIMSDDDRFFKYHDYNYSLGKIEHYFNSLVDSYYKFDINKRKKFVHIALKKVFSSPVNLYRLKLVLDSDTSTAERIIEILFMFLNKHSELILLYIKTGMWYVIENSNIYSKKSLFYKYADKFYNKFLSEINLLNSIYDFHIFYLLKNKFKNIKDYNYFINEYNKVLKGKNYLLDSLIAKTFNIKISQKEILNLNFNDEKWLYNYTIYRNSHYYQKDNDEISVSAFNAKKNKIDIVYGFNDINVSNKIVDAIHKIENKFENNDVVDIYNFF